MTALTIDGETFRVKVEGDPARPVLLLSNSLGADLSMWDAQMPHLLAHFRVVRYDSRGHGGSTTAGAPFALARLGTDVLAVLDALAIERTHVLGLSMGGAVAQWLLVNAPGRIDRAVLANTSARFGTPQAWNERIRTVLSKGTAALAMGTMDRWFSAAFRKKSADRVAAVESVFRATAAEGYAGCCAALRDMDMREALRAIDRPVLVVTGHDDPVTSASDIATMLDAIPGVRHVELDCRHLSNIEAQAAFDAAVVAFLTASIPQARARVPKSRTSAMPATRRPSRPTTAARKPLKPATLARQRPAASRAPAAETANRSESPPRKGKPAAATPVPAAADHRRGAAATPAIRSPVSKKAITKKAVTKAAATGASAPSQVVASKVVASKGAARKSAVKRTSTKTIATKATAKKTSAKKTPAKKTPAKTTPAKKTPAKTPATRKPAKRPSGRPGRTRPGRPGGRGRR